MRFRFKTRFVTGRIRPSNTSGVGQPGVQKIGTDMIMVASWGNAMNPLAQIQ